MRNTITLNGQSSEEISGLLIQSLPPISKPAMRSEIEEIDGRDGDIVTQLGFSAYDKEISIGLYGDYDINQIISFFNSEGTVVFSNEPDKYYNYQILGQIDFEKLIRFKTATVTMHVQPFKYSTTEGALILSGTSLISFNDFTQTTNGVTVTASNGSITVSGTPTAATEIYMPINAMALSAGDYTFEAYASGTAPESCSLRVIYNSPSTANSFGGTYVTLANDEVVSINATLSEEKTYNYLYFYITTGKSMNFTLGVDLIDVNSQTVSGEGSEIMLGDTAEAPFSMLVFKGDTAQQTYSGKNLNVYPYTGGGSGRGITFTADSDGTVVLNGQNNGQGNSVYFFFNNQNNPMTLPAGTYYIAPPSNTRVGFVMYDGTNYYGFSASNGYSMTFASSVSIRQFYVQVYHTDVTFSNLKIYPMLTTSAQHTEADYEPYVGGTASPNPDYPQTVKTVAGEQTITISDGGEQSQAYKVNLGKNLFDKNAVTSDKIVSRENGTISNANDYGASDYIPVVAGQQYIFSAGFNRWYTAYYDSNKQYVGYPTNTQVITIPSGVSYLRLSVYLSQLDTAQFEKGSTATSYAPYITPIELCKIGDYQDYIYKDGDDWYVHKEIKKLIVSFSTKSGSTANNQFSTQIISDILAPASGGTVSSIMSNRFISKSPTYIYANDTTGIGINTNSTITIGFGLSSGIDTVEKANTYASSNEIVAYYPLATPTDTQITDTTLLSQLEALETEAYSYKGQTIITTGANDENSLPHILEVEAYVDKNGVLVNSGNIPARPILTIYGDGNIAVYLNGSQVFNIALADEDNITIDTNAMEAYQGSTNVLKNRLVDGDYNNFKLKPGENLLEFSGVVDKCIVENYSRWL